MAAPYAQHVTKHPDSERTFTLDLTTWLAGLGSGVTISTADWTTDDFTIMGTPALDGTSKKASAKISGGVIQLKDSELVCTVTTSTGEVQPFTFLIEVVEP